MTAAESNDKRDESAAASGNPRQETEAQRDDRNVSELIQELRVAGLGVQVLFGFLLGLPFTQSFKRLSDAQQNLYLVTVVLSAVATALLVTPVAYHRLVFRRGMKEDLVRFANQVAIIGLAAVGLAVLAAVLLVTWFVSGTLAGAVIAAVIACLFGVLWFGVPLTRRHQRR
ncbi:MAG TPA: DUF6328 family protein [Trebonia sp.]|nr:DUF6328 family protein [Trebonia sp.]